MKPVTVTGLVSVFRANHISLRTEHGCSSPPILAEASNNTGGTGPRQAQITAREGDVLCSILPRSTSSRVQRARYSGDAQTYVQVLNVVCAVFPSDDIHAERQIGNAKRALNRLVLRHKR
jgi:hypothetical protein